jgi:hypothetical protein
MPATTPFPRFVTVGFVGARRLAGAASPGAVAEREKLLRARLSGVLDTLHAEAPIHGSLVAISSLAEGGDTVFAEEIAARGLPHRVFLPQTADEFFNRGDFASPESLDRSKARLGGASVIEVRLASQSQDRRVRFSECGFEIADACDVLIAAYDPSQPEKPGGTKETLRFARSMGTRTFEIALDGDMQVSETAATRASTSESARRMIAGLLSSLPAGRAGAGPYLPEVEALKDKTSSLARRNKNLFQYAAGIVVMAHVAATLIAGAALAFEWHLAWLTGIKILFLLVGIGLPAYLLMRAPQRLWSTSRLTAEICRSVLSLRGFPSPPNYLQSIALPELEWLVQSLEILHLKAAPSNRMEPGAFAAGYARVRIDVQVEFYEKRAASARRALWWLERLFFFFSVAALVFSFIYLSMEWRGTASGHGYDQGARVAAIALPMLAAACASLVSTLDLDRRIERFRAMAVFLRAERDCLRASDSAIIVANTVNRVERALLLEVVEWYSKHTYVRGP